MKIHMEDLFNAQALFNSVNKRDLKDLEIYKERKLITFTKKEIEDLRFTGLSNTYLLLNTIDG